MSLYSEIFYSNEINELFSDRNTIASMLRFESVLAQAQAENGIIPAKSAEIISQCCDANLIDIERLKTEIKLGGNAAIPLVKQLTRIVKNNDVEASKYVHLGATSQDVVDTATVLQIQIFIVIKRFHTDHGLSIGVSVFDGIADQVVQNTFHISRYCVQPFGA